MQIDQLAEVCVNGDQDPVLRHGQLRKGPVPWIPPKRSNLDNIMSAVAQRLRHTAPSAPVDQKPHESPTAIVASVSLAITACA